MRLRYLAALVCLVFSVTPLQANTSSRPNILIAISDDQSYPHTSLTPGSGIATPSIERVAKRGIVYDRAYVASPGCSPSRAALLTGLYTWQLEEAGTHGSTFPARYVSFQDRLEEAGYFVGYTGKGWGPGNWEMSERERNPAGPKYHVDRHDLPRSVKPVDYEAAFREFLEAKPEGQPFSFWFGSHEPHRSYDKGIGRRHGIDPASIQVPGFLPDTPEIREDLADYAFEVQWFDKNLGLIIDLLEAYGELENTLLIVTSDNGMPFARAKANAYDYGIHVPMVVAFPDGRHAGKRSDRLVSLVDITATIYDVTGIEPQQAVPLAGVSLLQAVDENRAVFCARERHSSSRYQNKGYPQRCMRQGDYLLIHNIAPERWPAGDPMLVDGEPHQAYQDIDAAPSKQMLIDHRNSNAYASYFQWAVAKRPEWELFDVSSDSACLNNLASLPEYQSIKQKMMSRLHEQLENTGDPRVVDPNAEAVYESYPRTRGVIRNFPETHLIYDGD